MILDAIIGLFVSIAASLVEAASFLFVPSINLFAAAMEAIGGIFVSGFCLGRIERKKDRKFTPASMGSQLTLIAIVMTLTTGVLAYPKIMSRKVTFVAEDGHSLPYAALVIHTNDGDSHVRTDNAGNLIISRFSTKGITLKDPRYVERTWNKANITKELMAQRTLLGSGLDSLADRLLKTKQ